MDAHAAAFDNRTACRADSLRGGNSRVPVHATQWSSSMSNIFFCVRAWFKRLLVLGAAFMFGFGASAQGVIASGIEAKPAPMSTASPQVTVLSPPLTMPGLNRQRTVRIYVPPGYASSTRRYPVLYMHDGQNLFDNATSQIMRPRRIVTRCSLLSRVPYSSACGLVTGTKTSEPSSLLSSQSIRTLAL